MMKKLLILMLVLGMASIANAYLTPLTIGPDDIELHLSGTTITVVGLSALQTPNGFGLYEEDAPSQGTVSGPVAALSAAGDLGAITLQSAYNGVDCSTLESPGGAGTCTAGNWFTFEYSGSVGDMINLYDYDVSYDDAVGQVEVIPEPMTIMLLGLGGLLLRRRK
jgi:hypothetical protein